MPRFKSLAKWMSNTVPICITLKNWLGSWQSRGWKKADKKPVENVEYWKRLLELTAFHKVKFHKVKGHAENPYNNRADALATGAIANAKKK
ncbi:MAG: RNase H family protein [Christensenellales bacterium]